MFFQDTVPSKGKSLEPWEEHPHTNFNLVPPTPRSVHHLSPISTPHSPILTPSHTQAMSIAYYGFNKERFWTVLNIPRPARAFLACPTGLCLLFICCCSGRLNWFASPDFVYTVFWLWTAVWWKSVSGVHIMSPFWCTFWDFSSTYRSGFGIKV